MKNKLTTFILTVCLVFSIVQIGAVSADDSLTVTSPNGCISISIETKDGKITKDNKTKNSYDTSTEIQPYEIQETIK